MKPEHNIGHVGTLGTDRVKMQFDENSIAHLQSVLVDLYSDPALAVIREYSTNALDSHREAGISDPIEVTLPSEFLREFIIRDHGVGMSADEIVENYSKYGWSSKRETDDQQGMLGLGGKSGLAYTSQFTLVSIKDGERVTVLVTRETDGGAALQIIEKEATTEPNGVTVTIPVSSSISTFVEKARNFYQWWNPGTVMLDGELVQSIWDESFDNPNVVVRVDPDVLLIRNHNQHAIVMGEVPYPLGGDTLRLPHQNSRYGYNAFRVAARVPIGAANFAPNREALNLKSVKTQETISDLEQFLQVALERIVHERLENAPTHVDAYKLANELADIMPYQRNMARYKGDAIPNESSQVVAKGRVFQIHNTRPSWSSSADRASVSSYFNYGTGERATLIVTGFKGRGLHASLKDKARYYAAQKGWDNGNIFFTDADSLLSPWCDHFNQIDYASLKAVVVPDDKSTVPERPKMRVTNEWGVTDESDIDMGDPLDSDIICYIRAADWVENDQWHVLIPKGKRALVLRKPEEARINKHYPHLLEASEWLSIEMRVKAPYVTEELAVLYYDDMHRQVRGSIGSGSVEKLVDFELRMVYDKIHSFAKPDIELRDARGWWQRAAIMFGGRFSEFISGVMEAKSKDFREAITAMTTRYPLTSLGYFDPDQAVEIVNALYFQRRLVHLIPATY